MKKIIAVFLLAGLLLASAAQAQDACSYRVLPYRQDADALCKSVFGERWEEASHETSLADTYWHYSGFDWGESHADVRVFGEADGFGSVFYRRNETDPSCNRQSVCADNVPPCRLTREEAVKKAQALLDALGLTDNGLQQAGAYASDAGGFYRVVLDQRLNGLPVYQSAARYAAYWNWANTAMDPNERMEMRVPDAPHLSADVRIGDAGVLSLHADWADFEPLPGGVPAIEEAAALEAFAASGIRPDAPLERCFLIIQQGAQIVARPAYRYQNAFVHAGSGERLQ